MRQDDTSRLERQIGRLLRFGAFAATAVLAAGLVGHIAFPASAAPDPILRAGLILLMATPVARVVASVIDYVHQRDWLFAALTAAVLVVLLGSLVYGISSGSR